MKFENVSFTYSPNTAFEIHALKNINMEIRDGEFIGISDQLTYTVKQESLNFL